MKVADECSKEDGQIREADETCAESGPMRETGGCGTEGEQGKEAGGTGQLKAADELSAGTRLQDRYRIERVLGAGAFGIVYLAADLLSGQRVAVKEYFPKGKVCRRESDGDVVPLERCPEAKAEEETAISKHGSEADWGTAADRNREADEGTAWEKYDPEADQNAASECDREHVQEVAEYLEEGAYLRKLSTPGLVHFLDCFAERNTGYLVMEYLPGGSLKEYRKEHPKTEAKRAAWMLRRVMEAAEYLHAEGIVHCDISPDNLLFDEQGFLVLTDLGAARFWGIEKRERALKDGYAPLEQYQQKDKIGPWTDLYAVCAVWYEMVTGKRMISAPARMAGERLKLPSEFALVDARLEQSFMRGLSPDIRRRYFSMGNLMQRLEFQEAESVTREAAFREAESVRREAAFRETKSAKWMAELQEFENSEHAVVFQEKESTDRAAALRRKWGSLWLSLTMEAGRADREMAGRGKIRRMIRRVAVGAAGFAVLLCCAAVSGIFYRNTHQEQIFEMKMEQARKAANGRTAGFAENETSSCFLQDRTFLEKYGTVTGSEKTIYYEIEESAAKKWKHPSNLDPRFYLDQKTAREIAVYELDLTGEEAGKMTFNGYASLGQEAPHPLRVSLTSECSYAYAQGQMYLKWDYATGRVITMSFTGAREKAAEYLEKMIPVLSPETLLTREEVEELFAYEEEHGNGSANLNERCYVSVNKNGEEYLAAIHAN